jgi:hypothetical protein
MEVFLDNDTRKVKSLFHRLVANKKVDTNYYEKTAQVIENSKFDQYVIITGFPKGPTYETDGPIGAFAFLEMLNSSFHNPQLYFLSPSGLKSRIEQLVVKLVPEVKYCTEKTLYDVIKPNLPTLALSIEFPGVNKEKVAHHMNGKAISSFEYEISRFWTSLNVLNPKSFTIGIGDGGNEMGLGNYEDEIRQVIPYGEVCNCPCRGGIATNISSDVALLATTSNWGAFGLTSLLGYNLDFKKEMKWLKYLNSAGIIDGVSGSLNPTVDNIPSSIEKRILFNIFGSD